MPTSSELNDLGIDLFLQGKVTEAAEHFRQALSILPSYANAHNNLGNALKAQGLADEAMACYQQALRLDPNHANAHNNLGLVFYARGEFAQAAECFWQALRIHPNYVSAQNNLGQALASQGQRTQAIECFRRALLLSPHHVDALINLGNALQEQKQWDRAVDCYRQALHVNPNNADAHYNLGNALIGLKQLAEATECYRRALATDPNHTKARNNLGNALKDQGKLAEAVACYEHVLSKDPRNAEAHNNMGIAYKDQGQLQKAEDSFARSLALDANQKIALWNRGLLRLSQGDFARGWTDYEYRWAQPGTVPRVFQQPRWDGSALTGKTILIYAEQGLGDTIQFIRYLPMVKQRGGTVVFECQPSLFKLLNGVQGVDQLVRAGETLPPFDVQIPLLSLPGLFGATLTNIPAEVPYLHADPKLREHYQEILRRTARRKPAGDTHESERDFTIGIVWQGSLTQLGDRRSLPLTHFAGIARLPKVQLVSLQVGPATIDLASASFPVLDLGSRFNPNCLSDLAAALTSLDLAVTIDTAAAHLAGALGVKAHVALAFAPDWRWLLDRSDCPWYPTLRLFRQTRVGAWNDVFARIEAEIKHLLVKLDDPRGSSNRG
jgi:tetratricopeptide (TPR) repeat protein